MNLFDKTITVFNRADGEGVLSDDVWFATVLDHVRVVETKGTANNSAGLSETDTVSIHIMEKYLEKPYLDPKAWSKLLDKTEAFTLTQGHDFIVIGDCSEVSTDAIDFYQTMKNTYDGVYRITNVSKYTAIPHFEVGGR